MTTYSVNMKSEPINTLILAIESKQAEILIYLMDKCITLLYGNVMCHLLTVALYLRNDTNAEWVANLQLSIVSHVYFIIFYL